VRSLDHFDPAIEFQLYLQWLTDASLRDAHKRALAAGMEIGIVADLAVGTDPDGSDSWSAPAEMLSRLSIGAPADQLGPDGQNWGLTALSPHALQETAFRGHIATLRAAMRNTGGIRLDHAMSMRRLWVIPEGAPASLGAYLDYPVKELMRLTALEAFRHKAVVIAEDLGTVPHNFRQQLKQIGFAGMRVLWFERTARGEFLPPDRWNSDACALTTTHDLPTLVGWWRERDIDWRAKLSLDAIAERKARHERGVDRRRLWRALKRAKCAQGEQPPQNEPKRMLEGALRYVTKSKCALALFPLEDIAGLVEQPNLPGTVGVHPNWRRRYPSRLFEMQKTQRRLALLSKERAAQ
jgi:4-alpha-glucanotransferase